MGVINKTTMQLAFQCLASVDPSAKKNTHKPSCGLSGKPLDVPTKVKVSKSKPAVRIGPSSAQGPRLDVLLHEVTSLHDARIGRPFWRFQGSLLGKSRKRSFSKLVDPLLAGSSRTTGLNGEVVLSTSSPLMGSHSNGSKYRTANLGLEEDLRWMSELCDTLARENSGWARNTLREKIGQWLPWLTEGRPVWGAGST